MRITPFVLVGALAVAATAAPATAARRKPIVKTYEATAPTPDPTNWASQGGVKTYSVCNQQVPQSWHTHAFTAPAVGKISIKVYGFSGDWDLLLTNPEGTELTYGGSSGINKPDSPNAGDESVTYKIKKAKTKINIIACNWAGSASATVKYTFTYA